MLTISIDTGGTFTDGFFQHGDKTVAVKVDTTPHDPVLCLMDCIEAGAERLGMSREDLLSGVTSLRYATTLSTNAIIQRRGSRTGLIAGEGAREFADDPVTSLIDPSMVAPFPVSSNCGDKVDEGALVEIARDLLQKGARVLVIALDDAWRDPSLERKAREILKAQFPRHYLGAVRIILSSDVCASGPIDAARNAAITDAYIHQIMAQYLYRAERSLKAGGLRPPLLVAHSNGGVARVAKTLAINTYGSGPAAGLYAGAHIARERGHKQLALLDVGGTSSDIAITDGSQPELRTPARIEGVLAAVPMIHVNSIGGGGGSIIHADDGGVRVGPDSAGASPGPACYGLGGVAPTITDANVVLGLIDPGYFLGGERALDYDRAVNALAEVAGELSTEVGQAAAEARRVVDEAMAEGIKAEAGADAHLASGALLAFGGGGGIHAASVASRLGIKRIVIPSHASVLSAYGGSLMEVRHLYERWVDNAAASEEAYAEMKEAAYRDMEGEGYPGADVSFELWASDGTGDSRQLSDPKELTEPGTIRLIAIAPVPRGELTEVEAEPHDVEPFAVREVVWPDSGEPVETTIFRADQLKPGARFSGPAVLEAPQTTAAVPEGFQLHVDEIGDYILTQAGTG